MNIDPQTWTIAYRKPRANRFLRVSTWSGTWAQAVAMARLFGEANPDLQVWYTSTRAAELDGKVTVEDVANIMTDSGKRVRIVETDVELPAELVARIPEPKVARERWFDGDPIANAEGVPAEPFVPVGQLAAEQGFTAREGNVGPKLVLLVDGRIVRAFHKVSAARAWLAANRALTSPHLDDLSRAEGDLLNSYAAGPRVWDAAAVFPIVLRLEGRGLIAPSGSNGAYALTEAGRALHAARRQVKEVVGAAAGVPEQVRAWFMRHGLDKLPSLTAEDILAARDADRVEAAKMDEARDVLVRVAAESGATLERVAEAPPAAGGQAPPRGNRLVINGRRIA